MDDVSMNTSIGLIAAACTTASFVPQLVTIHRQGGRDLSYGMLLLYMLGVMLWLIYGLRIHAAEVILANIVAGALVSAAIIMKRRAER
jgi:MtN3 and saliva related transmembrane protein